MFVDRTPGRLTGTNSENGGVLDPKNLRVKVLFLEANLLKTSFGQLIASKICQFVYILLLCP